MDATSRLATSGLLPENWTTQNERILAKMKNLARRMFSMKRSRFTGQVQGQVHSNCSALSVTTFRVGVTYIITFRVRKAQCE